MMSRLPDPASLHGVRPVYEALAPRATAGSPSPPRTFPVSDFKYSIATTFLISTMTLQVIAICVFFARVYTKVYPTWRVKIDDYLLALAFCMMTVMFGMQYSSEMWAWGFHHPAYRTLQTAVRGAKYGSFATPFWAWSTGLVKISIGFMLLRFQQAKGWRAFMYVMIALNIVLILFMGIAAPFTCRPFKSNWDFEHKVKNKKCWGRDAIFATMYISSACNVVTDIVFSLMPLTFLGKIRRPLREKIVIGILMALGLVASGFSLSRAILSGYQANGKGKYKDAGAMLTLYGLLSCLEVQTSLIAACVPTLRSSTKRVLSRLGMIQSSIHSSPYGEGSSMSGGPKGARKRQMERNQSSTQASSSIDSGTVIREMEEEEEAQYQMDPVTGRIICTTTLRLHTSQSNLNDEWIRNPDKDIKEEWEAQRIGRAM